MLPVGKGTEMMKQWAIAAMICLAVAACSKTETRQPAPGLGQKPSAEGNAGAIPVIVSASIVPENATARTVLIAQYKLQNPEDTTVSAAIDWYVDNVVLQGGQLATLEPGKHFKGSDVYAEITPINGFGKGKPFRTETLRIANIPPDVTSITFNTDRPAVDTTITASAEGTDADNDRVSFRYQWFVNGVSMLGPGESCQFSTKGLKKQDQIAVVVTAFDGTVAGTAKQSDILVVVNSAPRITSTPPTTAVNGVYAYHVTAEDPDSDRLTYSLVQAPENMTIDPATGQIRWSLPPNSGSKQEVPVKIKVDDGDGGTYVQQYSFFLGAD